jgi:hypothetical protein
MHCTRPCNLIWTCICSASMHVLASLRNHHTQVRSPTFQITFTASSPASGQLSVRQRPPGNGTLRVGDWVYPYVTLRDSRARPALSTEGVILNIHSATESGALPLTPLGEGTWYSNVTLSAEGSVNLSLTVQGSVVASVSVQASGIAPWFINASASLKEARWMSAAGMARVTSGSVYTRLNSEQATVHVPVIDALGQR